MAIHVSTSLISCRASLDALARPDEDEDEEEVGGRLREVGVSVPSHDEQPLLPPSMK